MPQTTDQLRAAILNLPCDDGDYTYEEAVGYRFGHRDARHAAAELVSAVPLVAEAPREMGDAAIERLAGEYIAADWEPDRYYRDMNVIAFARALLASVAPQPEQPNTEQPHLAANRESAVQGLDAAAGVDVPAPTSTTIPTAREYLEQQFPPGAATRDWIDGWDSCRQFAAGVALPLNDQQKEGGNAS